LDGDRRPAETTGSVTRAVSNLRSAISGFAQPSEPNTAPLNADR
jgi:hypothetical protein